MRIDLKNLCAGFRALRMNIFATVLLTFLSLISAGCIKNQFDLKITLPVDVAATYRVAYYGSASSGGVMVETAIAIVAGKGELRGVTRNPTVVSLFFGQTAQLPSCLIYAERGDNIEMSGKEENPLGWDIKGNKVNEELTKWRLDHKDLLQNAISAREDDENPRKSLNAAISKYVKENPESIESLILFTAYFDAAREPDLFKSLSAILEKGGVTGKYPELAVRQDMLTATSLSARGKGMSLKDIVVKSQWRNIDTVKLATGKKPALIYFWRRSDDMRKANIDSLKRLSSWRGDSSAMAIVDFCLDSDSTTWVYAMEGDSLKRTLRAWAPKGVADSDLMELGVGGSPWWIVTSASGNILYSGSDASQAVALFRKQKP